MKFRKDKPRDHGLLVDLTPMIDVVFLLIVFFLTTAQFARLTRADVELPREKGEDREEMDEPGVVINLLEDGTIKIDDDTYDLDGLRDVIGREIEREPGADPSNIKLLIRADRRLPARRMNTVVKVLRELGVGLGRFATEVPR